MKNKSTGFAKVSFKSKKVSTEAPELPRAVEADSWVQPAKPEDVEMN